LTESSVFQLDWSKFSELILLLKLQPEQATFPLWFAEVKDVRYLPYVKSFSHLKCFYIQYQKLA